MTARIAIRITLACIVVALIVGTIAAVGHVTDRVMGYGNRTISVVPGHRYFSVDGFWTVVYLDGERQSSVIAARSGDDGWVDLLPSPHLFDEAGRSILERRRGKVTFEKRSREEREDMVSRMSPPGRSVDWQ